MLIGLEMVKDRETREPMAEPDVVRLVKSIRDRGVIVGRNNDTVPGFCNVIILSPPLILTESQADTIVDGIAAALR